MGNIDYTTGWGAVIGCLIFITIISWIFLPWIVMRIESKMAKSIQNTQDIRDTLKDILYVIEKKIKDDVVDIELTEEYRIKT